MVYVLKPTTPGQVKIGDGGYITLAYGFRGVGKTQFLVDTHDVAEPLFFAGFDRSADHLLKRYKGKEFYVDYFKPQPTQLLAQKEWSRFEDYVAAAAKVGHGVFGIDNQLGMHELARKAFLPDKMNEDKIYPKEYGDVNHAERGVCKTLEDSHLFTVITTPASEIWKSQSQGTGLYDYEGWKYLDQHAVNIVRLFATGKPTGSMAIPVESKVKFAYKAWIEDAKLTPDVVGTVLDNPRLVDIIEACL